MSKSKDKRIAELELDNKQFESSAKTSLSTIQKLKDALKPSKEADFLDSAKKSADSLSFKTITDQLEDLKKGFSGFSKFTAGIFKNMADDVYNYGKKLWDGTIGQIQSGGSARALNIANAKFKLEGLDISWEKASKDISAAVDGTAYGFDAAANTAARLATAGIELGEAYGGMAHSLRAVSGVAAMTNSSYEEIGYIFSQVASLGKLQAQDAMQIATRGINVTAELGKRFGKTTEEIQEMMRKGEISFAMFAEAMNDAFGDQAEKANETFEGAMSNVKAALSRIGEVWYGPFYNAAIKPLNSIRVAINKIKAAFDDGNDATRDFKNRLTDIMTIASNLISYVVEHLDLSFFQDITNAMAPIMESLIHVGRMWENFLGITKKTSDATKETDALKKSLKDLSDEELELAKRTARGEFGNGAERVRRLKELTDNYQLVQMAVNECVDAGWDWAAVEEKIAKERANNAESYKDLENGKVTNFFREMARAVKKGGEALHNLGGTLKAVAGAVFDSFLNTFDYNKVATDIYKFAAAITNVTAKIKDFIVGNPEVKENLDVVFRIANNIYNVVRSIGGTLAIIISRYISTFFKTFDFKKLRTDIYAISQGLSIFFNNLFNKTKNDTGMENKFTRLWEVVNNLYRILSAVGSIIIELLTSIGIAAKDVFGEIGDGEIDIVKITAAIADWVEGLRDYVKENHAFIDAAKNVFTFIKDLPSNIVKALGTINDKIKEFTGLDIKEAFSDIASFIGDGIKKIGEKIEEYGGLFGAIGHLVDKIKEDGLITTIKNFFSSVFGSDEETEKEMSTTSKILLSIIGVVGTLIGFSKVFKMLKNLLPKSKEPDSGGVITKTVKSALGIPGIISNIVFGVKKVANGISSMNKKLNTVVDTHIALAKASQFALIAAGVFLVISSIAKIGKMKWHEIGAGLLVAAATMVGLHFFMKQYVKTLKDINNNSSILENSRALSSAFLAVGATVYIISSAMAKVGKNIDPDHLLTTFLFPLLTVEAILATIGGMTWIVGKTDNLDDISWEVVGLIGVMAIATALLSKVVAKMGKLKWHEALTGVGIVAAVIGAYVGALFGISKFIDKLDTDTINALSKNMLAFSAMLVITSIAVKIVSSIPWDTALISVGVLGAFLLAYAGCLALIEKLNVPTDKILAFSGGALMLGVAIGGIALSLKILASIDMTQLAVATAAVIGIVGLVAVAVGVLGYLNTTSMEGIVLVALGLAAVFASIGVMVMGMAIGIGAGAILLAKAFDMFVDTVDKLANTNLKGLSKRVDEFSDAITAFETLLTTHATSFATAGATFLGAIFSALLTLVSDKIKEYATTFADVINTYVTTFIDIIKNGVITILTAIVDICNVLLAEDESGESLVTRVAAAIWTVITTIGGWFMSKVGEIVTFFVDFIMAILNAWSTALSENGDALTAEFVRAFHNTSVFIQNALEQSKADFIAIGEFIIDYVWDGINEWVSRVSPKIKKWCEDRINEFKDNFGLNGMNAFENSPLYKLGKNIVEAWIAGIEVLIDGVKDMGRKFVGYFVDGITEKAETAFDTASEIGRSMKDAFIHIGLGQHSYAKENIKAGEFEVEAVVAGMHDALGSAKEKGATMFKDLKTTCLDKLEDTFGDNELFNFVKNILGGVTENTPLEIGTVLDTSGFESGYDDLMSEYGSGNSSFDSSFGGYSSGLASDVAYSTAGSSGLYSAGSSSADVGALRTSVEDIANRLDKIEVRMDTGALVGALYNGIDEKLGEKQILAGRGVYA